MIIKESRQGMLICFYKVLPTTAATGTLVTLSSAPTAVNQGMPASCLSASAGNYLNMIGWLVTVHSQWPIIYQIWMVKLSTISTVVVHHRWLIIWLSKLYFYCILSKSPVENPVIQFSCIVGKLRKNLTVISRYNDVFSIAWSGAPYHPLYQMIIKLLHFYLMLFLNSVLVCILSLLWGFCWVE